MESGVVSRATSSTHAVTTEGTAMRFVLLVADAGREFFSGVTVAAVSCAD
jgi:hypothetical protein